MADSSLIDELKEQYKQNPRRVFARLANEYRKQGNLTSALEICSIQVPLQPTYISGYIVYGQALFESGQLDEARSTFEAAIALDPENLIALRQLGDIARTTGDLDAARGWYYRLLEVDPQNVDVSIVLRALESTPAPDAAAPADGEHVSWSDINPERATTPSPVVPTMPRLTLGMIPEDLTAPPARAPEPEPIEMSGPENATGSKTPTVPMAAIPLMPVMPEAVAAPAEPQAPPDPPAAAMPPAPPAPPAAPAFEITGLEDFAQFSAPIAPPAPPPTAELPPLEAMTGEFSAPVPPRSSSPELIPEVEFQPPPSAPVEEEPALWSPPVTAEHVAQGPPAADSLRDTMAFPTPRSSQAMPEPSAATPEPPPVPAAMRATDARSAVDNFASLPEIEPPAAAPPPQSQEEAYDPTVGRMLDLNVSSSGDVPPAFMTETMAELYLQQGYHAEALQIYRALSAMRPDDPSLRERISRLEKGARSSISVAAQISEEVISAAHERASRPPQTSRSFFGGLAGRKAPVTPAGGTDNAAPAAAPPAPEARPIADGRPAAFEAVEDLASVPTELNGLFPEKVAAPDEAAASALAGAFSEEFSGGAPVPASGQPSRAASQPLSLDDVFRGQRPTTEAQRSSPSVSFDEFFSPRDSGSMRAVDAAMPARSADPGGPPEADLALFHEWLDGLKK